jgi:hypothetical protein
MMEDKLNDVIDIDKDNNEINKKINDVEKNAERIMELINNANLEEIEKLNLKIVINEKFDGFGLFYLIHPKNCFSFKINNQK